MKKNTNIRIARSGAALWAKPLVAALALVAAVVACKPDTPEIDVAQKAEDELNNSGFALSTNTIVLFTGRGSVTLEAVLSEEIAAAATLSWESESAKVIAEEEEGILTVTPVSAGTAVIKAKLAPKAGESIAGSLERVCNVIVLNAFTLSAQEMLFFEGEDAQALTLGGELASGGENAAAREALLRVARVVWTADGEAASIAGEAEGLTVDVAAGTVSAQAAVVRATLEALSGEGFNGGGVAAQANVTTLAVPEVVIENPGTVRLNYGGAARGYLIEAHYPGELDAFGASAVWESGESAVASFQGAASASGGETQATVTANSVGTAGITASVRVAGREFDSAPYSLEVGAYDPGEHPPQKITFTGVSGAMGLVNTNTSGEITAAAGRDDAYPAGNTEIVWSSSVPGVISFVDVEGVSDNSRKRIHATGSGTTTVKAESAADSGVYQTFSVTVTQLAVNITGASEITKGGNITLGGTTTASNTNIAAWTTDSALVSIEPNGNQAVITVAGLPTVETDVLITAQAQAAPAVTGVKNVRVKPHRFNITFNPNGGAGAAQDVDNVTYGSDAPITPPAFTKQNYNLLKWSAYEDGRDTITASPTAGALTGYEDAQTPDGRLNLYAIWQLAGAVAGQEENPDLMSKFGIKAPGYQASSITTADVSEAFNIIQAYIRTNITQSGSGQNMKLGDIKIGDYIMLPSLTVSDYTVLAAEPTYGTGGGGFTVSNPANLKVKVVGINPYAGKNGNGTDNHIVFQFEKSLLTRRINYVGSNHYYSITEVRRYLTPVDGESASGNFYNGLVNAGVPEGVFWNPVRVIGMRGGVTTVDTVNDKVFLLTLWEATGGAVDGNGYAITNGETSDNQGRLSAYNAGTVDASRIKYNLSGVAESWWVASPCSASPSMFCSASNVGKGGYTTAGGAYAGIAPAFCVK